MNRLRDAAYIMGLLLIVSQVPAHAYIDGGTGSYVMQITIAMILGVGYSFRSGIRRVLARIRIRRKGTAEDIRDDRG